MWPHVTLNTRPIQTLVYSFPGFQAVKRTENSNPKVSDMATLEILGDLGATRTLPLASLATQTACPKYSFLASSMDSIPGAWKASRIPHCSSERAAIWHHLAFVFLFWDDNSIQQPISTYFNSMGELPDWLVVQNGRTDGLWSAVF